MLLLSDIIRKVMIDKHITVTELSSKIGVATSNLSRKLQNKNEDYKTAYLCDIMRAMGCDIQIQIIDTDTKKVLYTVDSSTQQE